MTEAVMLERHRTLIRFEHAAGIAFGHEDEPATRRASRLGAPVAIALATFGAAFATVVGYLA